MSKEIQERIHMLRLAMKENGVDAYMVPTTDFHGSEYVNEYFKCREYLSGFTGSAGTLLVTDDFAGLWTDGRYFLQAEAQLAGSGIELMRQREEGVPTIAEYLEGNLPASSTLGFDGRIVGWQEAKDFSAKYHLRTDLDLAGQVWLSRPHLKAEKIYPVSQDVTGESSEEKLTRIRKEMDRAGATYHLVTCLEDIAWMYNLRGDDVKYTPVFFAYALVGKTEDVLYVLNDDFSEIQKDILPKTTVVRPYFQIFEDIKQLKGEKLLADKKIVSFALLGNLNSDVEVIDEKNPAELMKAIKNEVEIRCTKKAHIRDGVAMVNFIKWIKEEAASGCTVTELDAAEAVDGFRAKQKGFSQPSFETISGYGENGAIVHYSVTPETNREIKAEGFLLVDSGGQYEDGTTDITRTIATGQLTDEMRRNYTLVLKGHIAVARAKFSAETTGAELDALARRFLKEAGLNYNHGTGHGVGHLLSVHEGPVSISPRATEATFYPGMITSDEPGVYLEGKYGIRLENEVLCIEHDETGNLGFQPLTWCPWERQAIDVNLLDAEEICWINEYHKMVYEILQPYLDDETREWLHGETAPLSV